MASVCKPPSLVLPRHLTILQDLGLPTPLPPFKLAGRTALHMEAWEKITSNQWILQVVSGYKLEFIAQPHQSHRPVSVETGRQAQLVSGEIGKLLEKGAIQEVRGDTQEGFFSRVFLVPKKDGQVRPVLNLRPLNQFLSHSHFKMEGMHVVRDLLQKNDWMTRIDLKDAYFSVPIHPQHRKFLRFRWQEKCFQFTCLPFGLASAPRVFTKILRPIVGFLQSRGIRCVIYLDDLLLLHQNRDTLKEHTATALALLEALGFLVNYPKSMLDPSQIMVFLGFTINSIRKELSLPTEKVGKIVAEVKVMLDCHTVSARSLAQLIGKMTAALLAVHPAPLHYRSLQHLKHVALRRKGYDGQVTISPEARRDLQWWAENLSTWNGRAIRDPNPNMVIETDASKKGWGAFCRGVLTGGCWSVQEAKLHINSLEMLAAFYAIKAFVKEKQQVSILLLTDNMSVVAHVNRMGGTRSPLLVSQVIDLWSWCLQRHITITAQHIPGLENVTADYLSRHLRDRTDWVLEPSIFRCVNRHLGPLQVDLFATRFSRQLPRFFSWRPDPEAEATDAFAQNWSKFQGFAHPPWCLISRVLLKVRSDQASVVLITPLWYTQAWFPTLMELLVDYPILLPQVQGVIVPSPNCDCPIQEVPPQLVAWKVSGRDSERRRFQTRLLTSSCPHGEIKPMLTTTRHGRLGNPGAPQEVSIPLRRIFPMS